MSEPLNITAATDAEVRNVLVGPDGAVVAEITYVAVPIDTEPKATPECDAS